MTSESLSKSSLKIFARIGINGSLVHSYWIGLQYQHILELEQFIFGLAIDTSA